MNFTERVERYIKTGDVSDLQGMSELAFEITVEKDELFEKRKVTAYNQDLARVSYYKERKARKRKDGKAYTDTQADKLGKEQAMQEFDYTMYEVGFKRMKSLLDRLLEKKIEAAVTNKLQKELVANAR